MAEARERGDDGKRICGGSDPGGGAAVVDKGLKRDAIGYLSNLVIAVASTAPGYSLAATLGFIVAVQGVGLRAPAILIVSFIPMLLIAADKRVMKGFANGLLGNVLGWFFLVLTTLAALAAIPLLLMTHGGRG